MTISNFSASFFLTKIPITSIRAAICGGHTELSLWVNHGRAGSLVVRNEEVLPMLQIFLLNGNEITEEFRQCLQG